MKSEVFYSANLLQGYLAGIGVPDRVIGIVPTMGALHDGHRELIRHGRLESDILVVSIFVNPTQFAPNEDFDKYPRSFQSDLAMCRDEGVDCVFAPPPEEMYPEGFRTRVLVDGLGEKLCGRTRPTHFAGVTTVVCKLFSISMAGKAFFGWKDAQQLLIIQRMARDLNLPVRIVGVDTVREADGLAMSSRNRYLSPTERAEAPVLYLALEGAREAWEKEGISDCARLREEVRARIEAESKGKIDYVEIVSTENLEPLERVEPGRTLIAVACFWGTTRLIDNIRL